MRIDCSYEDWNALYHNISELVSNNNLKDLGNIMLRFTQEHLNKKNMSTEELIKYAHKNSDTGLWSKEFFEGFVAGVRAQNDE